MSTDLSVADSLSTRYIRSGTDLTVQLLQSGTVVQEALCVNNLNQQAPPQELQDVQQALLQNYLYKPDVPSSLVWDDLRFPAQGINPLGSAAPPAVDDTVYPGTLLFSSSTENIIAGVAQMPHAWKNGTAVHPHVHWCKTTSAVGGVVWEFRYCLADLTGVFGAYTDWEVCTYPAPDSDTANKHAVAAWEFIDMTGKKDSAIMLWQVRRNTGATADNYGAPARLYEFDLHYQTDRLGSVNELPV